MSTASALVALLLFPFTVYAGIFCYDSDFLEINDYPNATYASPLAVGQTYTVLICLKFTNVAKNLTFCLIQGTEYHDSFRIVSPSKEVDTLVVFQNLNDSSYSILFF